MKIEYSLLENGLDFIVCAINDINIARENTTDEIARKRLLKYAILNLSSGIELIFKYRLLNENWAYIFADINKANKLAFENGDFKSVDSISNIERLKNLCGITFSKDEEKILENLRKRRNKIEHFNINELIEAVEAVMCDSLSLVMNFIALHIDLKLFNDEEAQLFQNIQKESLKLEEVISAREKIINASAKNDGTFQSLIICPECLKRYLLSNDGNNECKFCYYSDTPENVAEAYISTVLGISAYSCIKHGGEFPQYDCFVCERNSMVFDYQEGKACCFNCDLSINLSDIEICSGCGKPIKLDDSNEMGLCSYCYSYRMSKMEEY